MRMKEKPRSRNRMSSRTRGESTGGRLGPTRLWQAGRAGRVGSPLHRGLVLRPGQKILQAATARAQGGQTGATEEKGRGTYATGPQRVAPDVKVVL